LSFNSKTLPFIHLQNFKTLCEVFHTILQFLILIKQTRVYLLQQSCEALEHVDRLGGVAYEQLLDGYLNRDAPLIVVDAMESWPVMNTDDFWFDNITQVSCSNIFNDVIAYVLNVS
jgi:hypothetical protein